MDVADAQNAVNAAQTNLDKATQAVNSVTKDVQDAQVAENNQRVAQDEVTVATNNVNQAQQAV